MGNPHAVVFVSDVASFDLARIGPLFERAPIFPDRVNLHVVQVDHRNHVTMRTWERGSGATRACGSGACAVCVACVLNDKTGRAITAMLPGGELELEWQAADNHVYKTGPAVEVFSGEWHG
jgi:diaminopimelate epimerase